MGGGIANPAAVDIEDVQLEEEVKADNNKVSKDSVSGGADNRNPSQILQVDPNRYRAGPALDD